MSKTLVVGLFSVFALAAAPVAQDDGGGGGGGGAFGGAEAGGSVRPLTRFEQFTGKLKIDNRTQAPEVSAILQAAAAEGAPVGQQMAQLQNQLVNAILAQRSEAEITQIVEAYTEAAARMTGIEAAAFAKIYAMLRPNQQGDATEAFALMAGWFQPAALGAGAQGGGGAGGQGGR